MPGFPLAALGAGLGIWAKNQQEQQAQRERQQMLMLQLQRYQQEQQDRQRDRATQAALFQVEAGGGGGIGPVNPTPGMSGGVGVPMARPAPALDTSQVPSRPPLSPGVGGAVRNQGDDWLRQNAPFPTQGRRGPQPSLGDISWTMTEPGPEAYGAAQGPGAPSAPSPRSMPSNAPPPQGAAPGLNVPAANASGAPQSSAQRTPQQIVQMMAPDAHAQAQKDALVAKIRQIPGLDDGQRGELFVKQWTQIRPQEAEYAREYLANERQVHQDARDDRRADRTDARADARITAQAALDDKRAARKWGKPELMTDPATGEKQYVQINDATGEMRPVNVPKGAELTKIGAKGSTPPLEDAQANFWAGVLKSGGSLPPGLRRSGVVEQIMKKMGSDTAMTPGDFIAKHAGVQADTNSLRNMTRMSDAAISFEKLAEKNFDVALKLAPDAVPTDLGPFFNRWIEEGETALGDPSVPPYVAAIITGANEYAKVMSGSTGTAASTVDSRKEARNLFSPYLSLPQISQVIAVAKADMKNRENTLTEQTNLIKQRLGSSSPVEIAPPATPKRTGQESQSSPQAPPQGAGEVVQNGWRYDAKTHQPLGPVAPQQ